MFELIKNTTLMAIGMAGMTRDKLEQLAREIAENAKLSTEKGQQLVNEVLQRGEKARTEMEASVNRIVGENLKRMNIPTRDDIAALQARLEKLEQLLARQGG